MTPPADDTPDLVQKARGGDEAALATLFSRFRDKLERTASFRLDHRLRGRLDISDVLQETFLDARQRLPHFAAKPEMSILGWLRAVLTQRIVDLHREHLGAQARDVNREVPLSLVATDATTRCLVGKLIADQSSPSEAVQRAELAAQLSAALEAMDPLDREVIALRHFEELSNGEAAEVLGLEISAASKRYVRALRRFRDVLAGIPGLGIGAA